MPWLAMHAHAVRLLRTQASSVAPERYDTLLLLVSCTRAVCLALQPATLSDTCWLYRAPLEPTTSPPSNLISNNIFPTSNVSFSHYASFLRHGPSSKEHQHQQQYPISKPTDTSTDPSATAVRLRSFSLSPTVNLWAPNFSHQHQLSILFFSLLSSSQNLSKWVAVATTKKLPFRIPEDLRSNIIATGPSTRKIFRISPSTTSISTPPTTTMNNDKNKNNKQQATMFTSQHQQQRGGDDGRG